MSALDDLLVSGGFIAQDAAGAQVGPGPVFTAQFTGAATVTYDTGTGKHVIDVGGLSGGITNSVWFFNGTTGTWSTSPKLTSLSLGNVPASTGALRLGNEDAIIAKDAGGFDAELLAYGSDGHPRFAGASFNVGSAPGYVLYCETPGLWQGARLTTLIQDRPTFRERVVQSDGAANPSKLIGYQNAYILPPAASGVGQTITIAETEWQGTGDIYSDALYHVMAIEVEVLLMGYDYAATRSVFRGLLRKLRSGPTTGNWQIEHGFELMTGETSPVGATVYVNCDLTLSGTHNGDIAVTLTPSGTGPTQSPIMAKVKMFGGGRYVA